MRRLALILIASCLLLGMSPVQVATVTPAYQAPATWSWAPTSLGATLTNRWLASSPSAGAVTTWTDTIAGLAPTQGTAGNRPVQAATSCNGFPGVTFDGTDDYLEIAAVTGLPTGSTAGEIFAVAIVQAQAAVTVAYSYGASGSNLRALRKDASNRPQIHDGNVLLNDQRSILGQPHAWAGAWSGTTQSARTDGRDFATPSNTISSLNTNTTRTRIGASTATSVANFFTGVICELDVVTGILSLTNEQRMEAYLLYSVGAQANLPYNHPYRFRRP